MTEPFLSINAVSKELDVPAYTLRYWEKQFPTSVKPTTGVGGRRYYRPETVAALAGIKSLLYDKGMTIAGVKKVMKDTREPKIESCPAVVENSPDVDRAIELLEQAVRELSDID